jgi:hypothetical protein
MTECKLCKKAIVEGEEFVVVGTYPKSGYIYYRSNMKNRVPPETWGQIYHKTCFLEAVKKEIAEKKEGVES